MPNWKDAFTAEERDLLRDFAHTEQCKVVKKFLEWLTVQQNERVLNYSIENGEAIKLAYIKAQAEGTNKAAKEFSQLIVSLSN